MQTVNWSELIEQASGEYAPLPVGTYNTIVAESVYQQSSTNKDMWVVTLRVTDGPYTSRTIRNNIVLTTSSPNAIEMFFRNMEAFGLTKSFFQQQPSPNNQLIAQKLLNAQVQVDIVHRVWDGKIRENVKSMRSIGSQSQSPSGISLTPNLVVPPAPPVVPPAPPESLSDVVLPF
jgi:hypothetical protein